MLLGERAQDRSRVLVSGTGHKSDTQHLVAFAADLFRFPEGRRQAFEQVRQVLGQLTASWCQGNSEAFPFEKDDS